MNSNIWAQVESLSDSDLKRLVLIGGRKLWCLGIPQSATGAEDIVQTAVLKALQGRRRWNENGTLFNFLAGVVCSEISNLVTSARYQVTRNPEPFDENNEECAVIETCGDETNGEVAVVLQELKQDDPEAHQVAMELAEVETLKPRELAKRLKMNVKDVSNARRRLQRRLENASMDVHSCFKRNGRKGGK